MTERSPHIFMSISKSMLGLLAGILAGRQALDMSRPVADIIPEPKTTAWAGSTVIQLLDMRTGVAFNEDYQATSGPMIAYRRAAGWNPLASDESPSDIRSFFQELKETDGPHGGRFWYVSPNTNLLGWIIERATGRRYADLLSALVATDACGRERLHNYWTDWARRRQRAACAPQLGILQRGAASRRWRIAQGAASCARSLDRHDHE